MCDFVTSTNEARSKPCIAIIQCSLIVNRMEDIDTASLNEFLSPSLIDWLTEQGTSELPVSCAGVDEFFESLSETELTELESSQLASSTEFKTGTNEDLKHLIQNNSNLNTKRTTSTWLRRYEKWAEHKSVQMDFADVPKEELNRVLQQFYAELVKIDGKEYEPESLK